MKVWQAFDEGKHDSNTNLVYWKDDFYLVHQTNTVHWATTESSIIVRKSSDAKDFNKIVGEVDYPNEDIRVPKFAAINDTLFFYCLANKVNFPPINSPYKTVYSKSRDGKEWSEFKDVKGDAKDDNWKLWRPKTFDNRTWYVTAHKSVVDEDPRFSGGKAALLKSTDGIEWDKVSTIHEGDWVSETAMEFLPNGNIICTSRCEYSVGITGDPKAYTMISWAKSPYKDWKQTKSYVTKLDGPAIFLNPVDNRTYAVGRYEPELKSPFANTGGFLMKKRTSIFLLEKDELVYLSDFPSNGDTAYLGAVIKGDDVYLSYYTSQLDKDMIWFQGQTTTSYVMMAKIGLESLEDVADDPPPLYVEWNTFDPILMFFAYIGTVALIIYIKRRK